MILIANGDLVQAKALSAFIIFHLYIFTHVYVLQRLKALSDGENEATFLHWTLWEIHYTPTAPKCSDR